MVSLKSFKFINESETDSKLSDLNTPNLQPENLAARREQQEQIFQQQQFSKNQIERNETIDNINPRRISIQQGGNENIVIESAQHPPHQSGNIPFKENNNNTSLNNNITNFKKDYRVVDRVANMNTATTPFDHHQRDTIVESQDNRISQNQQRQHKQDKKSYIKLDDNSARQLNRGDDNTAIVSVTMTQPNNNNSNDSAMENENRIMATTIETSEKSTVSPAPSSSSISIVVVTHDSGHNTPSARIDNSSYIETDKSSINQSLDEREDNINLAHTGTIINNESSKHQFVAAPGAENLAQHQHEAELFVDGNKSLVEATNQVFRDNFLSYPVPLKRQPDGSQDMTESRLSVTTESEHFEIVWSKLSYRIEPKWYKRFNYVDRVFTHFMSSQTVDNHSSATSTASSSAGMNDDQHQMHAPDGPTAAPTTTNPKSSLDPIEIFSNLNGTIKSGQMTAVLGPSGAGKTTLLNCLTGKLRKGVSGHINLKGANGKNLKMCTIPQKDHLLELLTVEENLWFASKIKNPEYGFDHAKNIERVIDLLGLKRCRLAKIGKISGGQHKRVSIAQELLSNPDILVLDEPTSGLDSLTCYKTILMLRDLVELSANNDFMKPMAIIVTIHQPQPKVFNLFHHVYILANGGRVIYEGSPEQSLETITSVTGLQPFDSSKTGNLVDPASFLIEIASEEYGVDVINLLSDHQRGVSIEKNNERDLKRHFHHLQQQQHQAATDLIKNQTSDLQLNGQNAKENYGFTHDFDTEQQNGGSKALSNQVFISNQSTNVQINDVNDGGCRNINVISNNHEVGCDGGGGVSRRSSKTSSKKRKKSANSIESGGLSSSASSGGQSSTVAITSQNNNSKKGTNNNNNANAHNPETQDPNLYMSEQLLYTRVANHKGRFWSHTATLTHRTLLTIRRDPLLMTSRVLFHLMIPILMGHVYGKSTGAANACPHYEPEIDITQIPSLVEGKRIEYMLEELHMSIENVSMFFIIMYAFAAAVLALNALSFPLNMQVLLKETRNGWYSMSSYVLAKTLADLPLELTMPCLTMLLVYPMTGQPSSYLQWRMFTICLIMTLCSLIAQTQALIIGALVMNSVQTAVFVSQASQLPWVILAGFTIRIKRLSEPLKVISLTSFYRLGCEAITLTRYGFGICPCDPQEITGEPVRLVGIPDQLRTVAQYWIDSMEASKQATSSNDTNLALESSSMDEGDSLSGALIATTTTSTTTPLPPSISTTKTDIFQHLANQLSYANSYGVNITSCDDVAPDRIRAINLGDNWLVARIWHLLIMLVIMKVLLYYAVKFSIGIRL